MIFKMLPPMILLNLLLLELLYYLLNVILIRLILQRYTYERWLSVLGKWVIADFDGTDVTTHTNNTHIIGIVPTDESGINFC